MSLPSPAPFHEVTYVRFWSEAGRAAFVHSDLWPPALSGSASGPAGSTALRRLRTTEVGRHGGGRAEQLLGHLGEGGVVRVAGRVGAENPRPCWSGGVFVFVEDAAEAVASVDVQVGDGGGFGDRFG
jgi:hypothetical protein